MSELSAYEQEIHDAAVAALGPDKPWWTTDQLQAEFTVEGFSAPYCVAVEKSTGKRGTLQFNARPRYYFGWTPA